MNPTGFPPVPHNQAPYYHPSNENPSEIDFSNIQIDLKCDFELPPLETPQIRKTAASNTNSLKKTGRQPSPPYHIPYQFNVLGIVSQPPAQNLKKNTLPSIPEDLKECSQ